MSTERQRLDCFLREKDLRKRFVAAVKKLKTDGIYQIFVDWHSDPRVHPVAHNNVTFLHWHRAFVRLFEIELQKADVALQKAANPRFDPKNKIALPFWDYPRLNSRTPKHATGRMWRDDFLGPTGIPMKVSGLNYPLFKVPSGPFAGAAKWPVKQRNPLDTSKPLVGYVKPTSPAPDFLMRRLRRSGRVLPTRYEIKTLLRRVVAFDNGDLTSLTTGQNSPNVPNPTGPGSFRATLEGLVRLRMPPGFSASGLHNGVHQWVGGTMGFIRTSPNDPVFWLHHAMVDRIWAKWQTRHPRLSDQYPPDAAIATARSNNNKHAIRADQPMLPWDVAKTWKGDGNATVKTDVIRPKRDS